MKIIKSNTLDSKVKNIRCKYCRQKNHVSSEEIKWSPLRGIYNEKGGYHYFDCKQCKEKNLIPERIAKKLKKPNGSMLTKMTHNPKHWE